MKTLLFLGHPGHELLAYKFLLDFKPVVVFLTTGSGHKDEPRIQGSIELIQSLGLSIFEPFKPFTDKEVYDAIMQGKFDCFQDAKEAVKTFIKEHKVERIVGDALEGFNPSHDVCRYMINATVNDLSSTHTLENFDFLQDEIFRNGQNQADSQDILLNLNSDEMEAKLSACLKYSALKSEVDRFFDTYGSDFFRLEHFRRISDTKALSTWGTGAPFYETHGRKRVEEGIYQQAILFEEHVKPLADFLLGTE